jgi:hypothetical protein
LVLFETKVSLLNRLLFLDENVRAGITGKRRKKWIKLCSRLSPSDKKKMRCGDGEILTITVLPAIE